ncbi:MAG: NYN domain-containing protein [Phormidesmis sp.]
MVKNASSDTNSDNGVDNAGVKASAESATDVTKPSAGLTSASKKVIGKPSGKKIKAKELSKPNSRTAAKQKPSDERALSIAGQAVTEQAVTEQAVIKQAVTEQAAGARTAEPETAEESLLFLDASLDAKGTQNAEDAQRSFPSEQSASSSGTGPASNLSGNPSFSVTQNQSVNRSSDRIAIFIDGSNLFYAASHLNIEVDYRRLLASLVRGRRLLRAYFYTGVDPQNEKQRGFLLWLNRHGHRVVSKELTNLPDGSRKANMHVEMAVDMMRIAEYCPSVTLLGGDGNLAYALQVLSQRGTFIEVVSLQSMTSDSLIDLADSYTDLADLRDEIKR